MKKIVVLVADAENIGQPDDFKMVIPIEDSLFEDKPAMAWYFKNRVGELAAAAFREH